MGIQRVGDLEISNDPEFQRREWSAQRVGWVVWLAVIVAALAGLMGEGPLSDATAGAEDDLLRVQYHRFVRHAAPRTLKIQLQPGAVQGKQARVWINQEYLEGLEIQDITPEPSSVEAASGRVIYVFDLDKKGEPATILFDLEHESIGRKVARVGLDDRQVVSFTQFVYP